MITHRALHHLLRHHPTTVLSGSRRSYSENGPQGDTLRNHEGHEMECEARTPKDSERILPPVLPTAVGSMEQVCVPNGSTVKVIR
jgi:hypothetical protein